MIRITKRPEPPKPIKRTYDYRKDPDNMDALAKDCFNKCYICEKKSSTIHVEHRVAHRGIPSLKFDWHNLFLSCGHCNGIKLDKYNNILDPSECDPEDHVAVSLNIDSSLMEEVTVEYMSNDKSVRQTAELLKLVYNGETTGIKKIESANLRNAISNDLKRFHQYIKNYRDEPDLGYDVVIAKEISRSSQFAAFKRKIVRDDPVLSDKFAASLVIDACSKI